jgi:hypothetical protein
MQWFKIIWQLPQTLVAGLVWLYLIITDAKIESATRSGKRIVFFSGIPEFGVSFGEICFLPVGCSNEDIQHEYGHSRQSLYLGPLYLLVVGLPSITCNILFRCFPTSTWQLHYYVRFPENWADKLGGVKRIG